MWFLVLLIIGLEVYHYYRLDTHQRKLREVVDELEGMKEAVESELERGRKAGRAGGGPRVVRSSPGPFLRNSTQGDPIKVERQVQEYWKKQGWTRRNGSYRGYYRTPAKSFKGEIKKNGRGFEFFIFRLPKAVKSGGHGSCFQHLGGGKYWIHFSKNPRDLSGGIITVERILRESLGS